MPSARAIFFSHSISANLDQKCCYDKRFYFLAFKEQSTRITQPQRHVEESEKMDGLWQFQKQTLSNISNEPLTHWCQMPSHLSHLSEHGPRPGTHFEAGLWKTLVDRVRRQLELSKALLHRGLCQRPRRARFLLHRVQVLIDHRSPLKCSKLLKEEKSYLMFSQITMTICSLLILNTFDDTIYCLSNFHFMSQPFLRWAECFCAILLRDPYLATAVWPTAKSWAKSGERTEER